MISAFYSTPGGYAVVFSMISAFYSTPGGYAVVFTNFARPGGGAKAVSKNAISIIE